MKEETTPTIEQAKLFFDEVQKKEPMIGLGSWGMSSLSRIPFVIHPTIHRLMVDFAAQQEQITSAPLLKRIEELEETYWHDDMVLRFAELYRWSSTRFTIKAFKESKDWKSVNIDDAKAEQKRIEELEETYRILVEAQDRASKLYEAHIVTPLQKRISELEEENNKLKKLVNATNPYKE